MHANSTVRLLECSPGSNNVGSQGTIFVSVCMRGPEKTDAVALFMALFCL